MGSEEISKMLEKLANPHCALEILTSTLRTWYFPVELIKKHIKNRDMSMSPCNVAEEVLGPTELSSGVDRT